MSSSKVTSSDSSNSKRSNFKKTASLNSFKRRIGLKPSSQSQSQYDQAFIRMQEEMLRMKEQMLRDMMRIMGKDDPMVKRMLQEIRAERYRLRQMKGEEKRRVIVKEW